jgi:hypothetical protein
MAGRHTRDRITGGTPGRTLPRQTGTRSRHLDHDRSAHLRTFSVGGPPGPAGVAALSIGCPSHDFSAPTCRA